MRFMMIVLPNIPTDSDYAPDAEAAARMGRYNEQLSQAGVLLSLDGLQPTSEGTLISFSGGAPSVTDGPFAESKELIGGYWMIDVASREEAVQWATRAPMEDGDRIEVRRVFELEDHAEDVQSATELSSQPPEQTRAGS